ncbi:DUF3667 domain-containing protein [Lysobacter korlensis]|uniref:DUF3667 domain-containing protein n=1 Tax=Lysobacter korlensis TaxID=553636 RepID=A0ABV6RHY1_9GAMM
MHATDLPASCENCTAALQGRYCHACGQSASNPLRHLGHAVEEVFESFWHLDGRVFRTLRDLFVPGRVACNYLAGQRARYIAPLRMFVITTLATFFLAGLATPSDRTGAAAADDLPTFARASTVEAVEAALDSELARLEVIRSDTAGLTGVDAAFEAAEARIRRRAADRMAELGAPAAKIRSVQAADPERGWNAPGDAIAMVMTRYGGRLADPARGWDARSNLVDVGWLPDFADRWFNHRAANAVRNSNEMQANAGHAARLILAALPAALFVLVPVFALLLKLLYVRAGWSYLEHLVVGLYSHVFLLLGVAALVLLGIGDESASRVPVLGPVWGLLQFLATVSLPLYLLLMQKNVYRQGWPKTTLKYLVLGGVYLGLVLLVTLYAVLAGLTSGS